VRANNIFRINRETRARCARFSRDRSAKISASDLRGATDITIRDQTCSRLILIPHPPPGFIRRATFRLRGAPLLLLPSRGMDPLPE